MPYSEKTTKLSPGPLSLDDYLTLVDETCRLIHSDKRGSISAHLAPILARLDLDFNTWLTTMRSPSRFLGGAIGSAAARAAEAVRRGVKWVVDRTNENSQTAKRSAAASRTSAPQRTAPRGAGGIAWTD